MRISARALVPAHRTVAAHTIDQATSSPAKRARKLLKRAKRALKQAEAKATRAARGKKPALKDAAYSVAAGL